MRHLTALPLIFGLIFGLSACGGELLSPPPPEYPVTVGDFVQEEAPRDVISLTPAMTEMVTDLGYAPLLRGVSDFCGIPPSPPPPREAGDDADPPPPPAVRMGTVYSPDWDAIAGFRGALVLTSVPLTQRNLLKLQQAGYSVLTLPRADSSDGIRRNLLSLAAVLGGRHAGAEAADRLFQLMDARLAAARASLSACAGPMDAALLAAYPCQMATGDTLEGKLLESVGFTLSGAAFSGWQCPAEELKSLEPDVIFCARAEDVETVRNSREYRSTAAVRNGKVTAVDFTAFQNQSLRMFDTLAEMASFAASPGPGGAS